MSDLVVRWSGDGAALSVAATDLASHLQRMTGDPVSIDHHSSPRTPGRGRGLWLQVTEEPLGTGDRLQANWASLDDVVTIDVRNGSGVIRGPTDRSVLLGAYRFLREAGCRWLRPTDDGTYVPRRPASALTTSLETRPTYRHRMMLFDGAVSWRHLEAAIRWAPKLGFNQFLLQFRDGYAFFDRWYSAGRPRGAPSPFALREAQALYRRARGEIKAHGLELHTIGHSWTCDPLGVPFLNYDTPPLPVPADSLPLFAEIEGVRELNDGNSADTNLCYSNSKARARVVADVVRYAADHPMVDVIHIWLADGLNKHCECASCRRARPSDWYVRLLNEIDDALTTAGSDVRLAFIAYADLLWPPERERLRHPERFLFLFAAIDRTHSRPLVASAQTPALEPYVRNQLVPPRSPEGSLAHLRAWQDVFAGDSALYAYHLWRDQYHDPGGMSTARILHADLRELRPLGLNGFASCQALRTCFPTGLGMAVLASGLWDPDTSFEAIAEDYFEHAFGTGGDRVRRYLERLSDAFIPPYLRDERPIRDAVAVEHFRAVPEIVASFRPEIERGVAEPDEVRRISWEYLRHHADICTHLARALEARARGDLDRAERIWHRVRSMVRQREPQLESVLDVFLFTDQLDQRIAHRTGPPAVASLRRGDV